MEKWLSKLRHEFGVVLENKEEELKKFEAFLKEEIYNCSRFESATNSAAKPNRGPEVSDKKVRELELRIR